MKKYHYCITAVFIAFMLFSQTVFSQTWATRAAFTGASRCYSAAFSIGSKGYICGGSLNSGGMSDYTNEVWQYDASLNTWQQMNNFPGTDSRELIGFSINNKGYILDGIKLWEYTPASDSWVQKTNFAGSNGAQAVFVIADKAYLGLNVMGSGLWEYTPSTDTWLQKASLPASGTYRPSYFTSNQKGYICGGAGMAQLKLWEYTPATDSWALKLDSSALQRSEGIGFSGSSKGFIGLGITSGTGADFWSYKPATNKLEKNDNLDNVQRLGASAFSINNQHYVVGGVTPFYQFVNTTSVFVDADTVLNPLMTLTAVKAGTCTGDSLTVAFSNANFSSATTFDLYLSDSSGSFTNKTLLAQKITANAYDTFFTAVPAGIKASALYKLRLEVGNLSLLSAPSASTTLAPKPDAITISGPSTVFKDSVNTFTVNGGSSSSYLWFTNGASGTSTNTSINLSWNITGNQVIRTLEISASGCKGDTAVKNIFVDQAVGLTDLHKSLRVLIYPNPATNLINVELGESEIRTFRVTDLTGKIISQDAAGKGKLTIDTGAWSQGIYFLHLDGSVYKFVKQ